MLPNNYVVGDQQNIPRPHPQPGSQQGMPNMTPDQNRLWQQQMQLQRLMAALMAAGLSQQQVIDLLRSRPLQPAMPPPFGMNPLGANSAPQLPPGVFPASMNPAMPSNYSVDMTGANALRMQGLPMGQNGMQDGFPPQRRSVSVQDIHEKAQMLQKAIEAGESRVKALQTQPSPLSAEQLSSEIAKTQRMVDERKQALSRIMAVLQIVSQGGVNSANGPGGLMPPMNMRPPAASPVPASQGGVQINGAWGLPMHTMHPMYRQSPFSSPLAPLDPPQFQKAYWEECFPTHVNKDKSMLAFEGRPIDLYQLHCEVMNAGSYQMVNQKDLWPVIGAKLGFLHSNQSGSAFPAHLKHIYEEFLLVFDFRQALLQQRQRQSHQAAAALGAMLAASTQGLPDIKSALTDIKDPQMLQTLVTYSQLSVSELQSRGVAPQIIALVERHRDQLKQTWEMQRSFRDRNTPSNAEWVEWVRRTYVEGPQGMNGANGMPSSAMAQDGQHPQMGVSHPQGLTQPGLRISPQQTQAAFELVKRLRVEYKNVATPRPQTMVPDNQRIEYNAAFKNLCWLIGEMDQKLLYYAMFLKEEQIKKFIDMIDVVHMQRELLAGQGPPKYIANFEHVKLMVNEVIHANMMFKSWFTSINAASVRPSMVGQPGVGPNAPGQPGPVPAPVSESASSTPQPPSLKTESTFADHSDIIPHNKLAEGATVFDTPAPTSRTSLLPSHKSDLAYGTVTESSRKRLGTATLEMAALFLLTVIMVGGTFCLALLASAPSSSEAHFG